MAQQESLGAMQNALKNWLSNEIRIDQWTLNAPEDYATVVDGTQYPSNTAIALSAEEVAYERRGAAWYECEAEFPFKLQYRFTGQLDYHQVPRNLAHDLLNNILLKAASCYGDISEAIQELTIPEQDDIICYKPNESNGDWILLIQPKFRVRFNADFADLSGLQPTESIDPFTFNSLTIITNRGEIGFDPDDESTYSKDREFIITGE
ncbi:MAG: hypothetical protein ACFE0I_02570 [Elainellaceae cyanobacterium]